MIPASQTQTAAFLRTLAGHDPLETHISAVFVGGDAVWKLRKAVQLPFVDFSTLAERHRTALREFELNAPHALIRRFLNFESIRPEFSDLYVE